ncbi:MAG: TetR/AcrR family transcriptional regulator [Candidatus Eisenbacteria bacterium]|uniref:TetR/AcrR family transcriptional regulator n=1 Tax=Eiseniibacteriota bacterium TaxID=2212470 RepID=A0A7Y2E6K9_UNCEI|nr:TetR/AcrR family transcriptional regulator [Candidatus Eisenbacteria bacterium]
MMVRKYDSTRRKKASEETRNAILQAALKLHWEGITEYEPIAREAECSIHTLRKHFPTKEALYHDCTRLFAESLTMPNLDSLSEITSPKDRLENCVSELCRIHEAMFGYAWLGAHARTDSPTLDQEMRSYEGLTDAIVEIIAPDTQRTSLIRGLLDFLTYRALRLSGRLSPEDARKELIKALRPLIVGE